MRKDQLIGSRIVAQAVLNYEFVISVVRNEAMLHYSEIARGESAIKQITKWMDGRVIAHGLILSLLADLPLIDFIFTRAGPCSRTASPFCVYRSCSGLSGSYIFDDTSRRVLLK